MSEDIRSAGDFVCSLRASHIPSSTIWLHSEMWACYASWLHSGVLLTCYLLPTTRESFNNMLWLPVQPHSSMAKGCRCILRFALVIFYSFQLNLLWMAAMHHDGCESCVYICWPAANHYTNYPGANLNSPFEELLPLLPKKGPTRTVIRWNLSSFAFVRKLFLILDPLSFSPATLRWLCSTPLPWLENFPLKGWRVAASLCLYCVLLVAVIPGCHFAGMAVFVGCGSSASGRSCSPAAVKLNTLHSFLHKVQIKSTSEAFLKHPDFHLCVCGHKQPE